MLLSDVDPPPLVLAGVRLRPLTLADWSELEHFVCSLPRSRVPVPVSVFSAEGLTRLLLADGLLLSLELAALPRSSPAARLTARDGLRLHRWLVAQLTPPPGGHDDHGGDRGEEPDDADDDDGEGADHPHGLGSVLAAVALRWQLSPSEVWGWTPRRLWVLLHAARRDDEQRERDGDRPRNPLPAGGLRGLLGGMA